MFGCEYLTALLVSGRTLFCERLLILHACTVRMACFVICHEGKKSFPDLNLLKRIKPEILLWQVFVSAGYFWIIA